MTTATDSPRVPPNSDMRTRPRILLLPLLVVLMLAACASDGYDSVQQMRTDGIRPERPVSSDLAEMRDGLASMRDETLTRLDDFMGGAPAETSDWTTPIFDALDFALSITRLF